MLAWITQKLSRPDDSASTEAEVRDFLSALAHAKPAHALDDIGERMAGILERGLEPAVCRRVVRQLDEAAQPAQGELWTSICGDALGTSIFDGNWRALAVYQRSAYGVYAHCLAQLPAPAQLDAAERQDMLLMATRAMAALAAHSALMRIRYRDPHPEFWTDAHALFAHARQCGVAQSPVRLYPQHTQQTTIEREYVGALLLEAAPTGNLLPAQTHCLYLVLRHFGEHYAFADRYTSKQPYYIEPAKGKPPRRWLPGMKPRAGVTFFGLGNAFAELAALREATHAAAAPPKWVAQSGIDAGRCCALLDTLIEHWSAAPPQRRSRRDRQVAAVLATHGFVQIYRMIAYSRFSKDGRQLSQLNYAETAIEDLVMFKAMREPGDTGGGAPARPLTPMEVLHRFEQAGDPDTVERWSVVDTSEGGLGVIAERHGGWLRAGMLVGYRYHDSIDWRIAIARRLRRTAQGKLGVGLSCKADPVGCARLRQDSGAENAAWVAAGDAVYADAMLIGGEQPLLIAPPGVFAPGLACTMLVEKRAQAIRFTALIERGIDFECIAFAGATPD